MRSRIVRVLVRTIIVLATSWLFLLLFTPVAHADNCGSLADCFPTTDAATMVTVAVVTLITVGVLALPQLLENPLPPGGALPPSPPPPVPGPGPGLELPPVPQFQGGQIAHHFPGPEAHHIYQPHPAGQQHPEGHHQPGTLEEPPTSPLSHQEAHQHAGASHEYEHRHEHKEHHEYGEPDKHEEPTAALQEPRPSPELPAEQAMHQAGGQEYNIEVAGRGLGAHQRVLSDVSDPLRLIEGPQADAEVLLGLHHITALASDPQRNIDFYAGLLGLRLVKLTVSSEAPNTYQLYYGDTWGQPGSILSFICTPNTAPSVRGTGQATSIAFAVTEGALQFWAGYLAQRGITVGAPSQRFGTSVLSFFDPDGLQIDLVVQREAGGRGSWQTSRIPPAYTLRGLYGVSVAVGQYEPTDKLLDEALGFSLVAEAGNRRRYQLQKATTGAMLDVVHLPTVPRGTVGVGMVRHIGWRTPGEAQQLAWSYRLDQLGIKVSQVTDQVYFRSLYFYEPGGVLFDIATDSPGFTVNERVEELGTHLLLPPQFEAQRAQLQRVLPPLRLPTGR